MGNAVEEEWCEENLVMVSAIQHYSYCPRQCALIHREQIFDENLFTIKGRWVHEAADQEKDHQVENVRTVSALPIWSQRLGLVGRCDVVEFHGDQPYPVEYKHGRLKQQVHDELQLCAQAICLEEMFSVSVPVGAIYQHSSRSRREVVFTEQLRERVAAIVVLIRNFQLDERLPPAIFDQRCDHCSLRLSCLPMVTQGSTQWHWTQEI
jgi:CRISPR-associated exonuclease Cas4